MSEKIQMWSKYGPRILPKINPRLPAQPIAWPSTRPGYSFSSLQDRALYFMFNNVVKHL